MTARAVHSVRELVVQLMNDPDTRAELATAPAETFARHGFAGFSDADVRELIDHVSDSMPAAQASAMQILGEDGWQEVADADIFDPLAGVEPTPALGTADNAPETITAEFEHDKPDFDLLEIDEPDLDIVDSSFTLDDLDDDDHSVAVDESPDGDPFDLGFD